MPCQITGTRPLPTVFVMAVLASSWSFQADASALQSFSGVVGGAGTGSIAGNCTTYVRPAELAFFGTSVAQIQVLGGNAACGYSGGSTNLTTTNTTAPLATSASLVPTALGAPGFAESFDGTAKAIAAYGSLSAFAHGNLTTPPVGYTPGTTIDDSVAAALFSDTLTATVSHTFTDLSSAGSVRYLFSVSGSLSTPGVPAAFLGGSAFTTFDLQQNHGVVNTLFSAQTSTGTVGTVFGANSGFVITSGSTSGSATIESGPFAIDLLSSWDFMAGLVVNANGNADDNFFSTVKFTGLELFDHNGNAITDFSLKSASGTTYFGSAAVGVPEPSESLLMFAGLAAMLGLRGRRPDSSRDVLSRLNRLVGVRGFEPPASTSRT